MSEIREEIAEICIPANDKEADDCIKAIKEAQDTKAFWRAYYDEQYQKVTESCDVIIENNTQMLREYFNTVPHKKTATQENYRLPSGKLTLKDVEPEYKRDDKKVIEFLKKHGGKYIRTKEEVDWAAMKKTLLVVGETAATEDGEIIPGIKVIERPQNFIIDK